MLATAWDVERYFTEALARAPGERDAYLESVCGSNTELRKRILVLIAAHESAGDFLHLPAERPLPATEAPGTVIGNYTLVRVLGEGGFGTVFLAEQRLPVRRQVALKIIKLGMDTRQVIRRFEAERQALAMMDHPHIAKVLDAGATEQGRPYFVMELAIGVPITTYCDEQRLTLSERLDLFVQVCEAVQHAHQKGIIHRDIKPSNVIVTLLDGRPVPKVIDFGIAKATQGKLTEQTLVTESRQLMGTPAYMSPEQASMGDLDIDTRTDVYSLGVLLCELLTGATPFSPEQLSKSERMISQIICETEAPRPSVRWMALPQEKRVQTAAHRQCDPHRLVKALQGELDWMVMKCLEKDRARRYETALGLARDIERYRSDEPIEASPPSTLYVMKKFARRHRMPLQIATAAALVLVIASIVSLWQAIRATRAERQITAEQKNTAAAQKQAIVSLADMYMAKGLESTTSVRNGQSLLWFAKAASLSEAGPESVKANMVRYKNWSYGQWVPIAAVEHPDADRLAFNPSNPRYLLTDARHGPPVTVRFWDLQTEREIALPSEWGEVRAAAWSDDGRAIAGSQSGNVLCFQAFDLTVSNQWSLDKPVTQVALSGKTPFAAAAAGELLYVWNTRTPGPPAVYAHTGNIRHVAFSRNGSLLLTADESMRARVFAVETSPDASARLRGPTVDVRHVLRAGGKLIAPVLTLADQELMVVDELGTREKKGLLKWYDSATGAVKTQATDAGIWNVRQLSTSADGAYVAVASGNGYLIDSKTHQPVQGILDITIMAFNANPPLLVMGSSFVVSAKNFSGNRIGEAALPELGAPAGVTAFSFSGDGRMLSVLQPDGVAQVWKMPSPRAAVPSHTMAAGGTGTWPAFSSDGKYVAPIGTMDGHADLRTLQVSDAVTGAPAGTLLQLDGTLLSAAFSHDGQWIVSASGKSNEDKRLRFWDWRTGKERFASIQLPAEPVWLAYASDDRAVAVHCLDGRLLLFDAADGHLIWEKQCAAVREPGGADDPYPYLSSVRGTVQFSHDGGTIFTLGSPVVEAWDRGTGKRLYEIKHDANCWVVAESPDGKILATGSEDRNVRLLDAATGEPMSPPIVHPRAVGGIEFTRDGTRFCTVCFDNETRIWDTQSRQLLQSMPAPGKIASARFTSDGRRVVEASFAAFRVLDARTGYPLTPTLGAPGFHSHIDLTPDDRWAAVSGSIQLSSTGGKYSPMIFDLQALSSPFEESLDDAQLWAELLSCGRINGSTFARLTNAEWLDRWRRYRSTNPAPHTF